MTAVTGSGVLTTTRAAVSVDISETYGAPSPTVVARITGLPGASDCVRVLRGMYPALAATGIPLSKVLFLAPTGQPGQYLCRFLQLIGATSETFGSVATRRDCLNSMVAACHSAVRFEGADAGVPATGVTLRNVDTGLVVSARTSGSDQQSLDIAARPLVGLVPASTVVAGGDGRPSWRGMLVNNPYLVVDARTVGLSRADLIQEQGTPDAALLRSIDGPVREMRRRLRLPARTDLPKVAFLQSCGNDLVARTTYLGGWHPGLPLTGAISLLVAALVPTSPWYNPAAARSPLRIHSCREILRISASWDPVSGVVTAFSIPDRRVVTHVSGLCVHR